MIDALAKALQAQHVAEEKIRFIVDKLNQIPGENVHGSIWRTFCDGCLEMGIDPQTVFARAVTSYLDASDTTEEAGC